MIKNDKYRGTVRKDVISELREIACNVLKVNSRLRNRRTYKG